MKDDCRPAAARAGYGPVPYYKPAAGLIVMIVVMIAADLYRNGSCSTDRESVTSKAERRRSTALSRLNSRGNSQAPISSAL